jgi:hypothetical protein
MPLSHYIRYLILALFLIGCGQPDNGEIVRAVQPTNSTAANDVANLVRHPPSAGQAVEIDAYFTGARVQLINQSEPSQCAAFSRVVLTDLPFVEFVDSVTQRKTTGAASPAWIIVALAGPNPDLPYHGRFRGHLISECGSYFRFRIDNVVAIYERLPAEPIDLQKLPSDVADWGGGSPTTTPRPTILTTPTPPDDPNATAVPTRAEPYPPPMPAQYPAP